MLWHEFSSLHLQSLLDFGFLSFHLEDIFCYSHTQDGKASRLFCFLPAYLSHLLRIKAFERIILSSLLFFLESNSILSPRQASFRPGQSTLDQIVCLSQSISDGFNKPRPDFRKILTTIDFSKAFDSAWHFALFHKLISAGLPLCFARWTQSFLSDRRACVVYQNHKSRSFRVRRGVPQGSVLGPVLFSLFSFMIFLLLCLLLSAALFTLTIWPFSLLPLGPHCGGGHTKNSVSIGGLV